MTERPLDVICMGRASVDLYGEQVGGRLEDMTSFAKYVGGCPTNVSVGTARLGLKSALITGVGDEHMGRFIREYLEREGVDVSHIKTDPERLTALVILGIRDQDTFPLIFFRIDCADMAISEDDFDADFIASATALMVTGTHLSAPQVEGASRAAVRHAKVAGTRVVLDIDYRPVLWGLTGAGEGEDRFVASAKVTEHFKSILPDCDLIVGTEEEFHIAGGSEDTMEALRRVRESTAAILVVKRGPLGCSVFPDAVPRTIDDGITGAGFPVEIYNVLGAGDAFLSGFLRGWLRGEALETCCTYANACGAIVVSRHGCAPAMPTWVELSDFLEKGSTHKRLREDRRLSHIHRATTRRFEWPAVYALAFDHRAVFEEMAARHGVDTARIPHIKTLIWQAVRRVMAGHTGMGIIADDQYAQQSLFEAVGTGCWIARPIEAPGVSPLQFERGPNIAATLREWPAEYVVKCRLPYYKAMTGHQDRAGAERQAQLATLQVLSEACADTSHELLLEIAPPEDGHVESGGLAQSLDAVYAAGVYPDWWKMPLPGGSGAWSDITRMIEGRDPYCRGVLLLGHHASLEELEQAFETARRQRVCRGFAVGRAIFNEAAEAWFAGRLDDAGAVSAVAKNYGRLVATWQRARAA